MHSDVGKNFHDLDGLAGLEIVISEHRDHGNL
jgi:hypothetical protein